MVIPLTRNYGVLEMVKVCSKVILFLAMAVFSLLVNAEQQAEESQKSEQTPLPLEQIKVLSDAFAILKSQYVDQVSDEQLIEYAIKGMVNGLDPHSVYLSEDDFTEFKEKTSGRFAGLGIEITMQDGFVKVVTPIDDTPAAKAGIKSGDLIVRIDNNSVAGLNLSEAIELLRGEKGSKIVLKIVRDGIEKPFDIEVIRDIIKMRTVKSKMLENNIAYIRITQFQTSTAETFRKQLKLLKSKSEIAGLVLDLRNNPGGILNSAVSISDAFITKGQIVSTKGRREDSQQVFTASPKDYLDGLPMIVLVNGGSASASEIVAGALQDHGRAIILGTKTFGKGSVQSFVTVADKKAIKMTTARYYTPKGRSIQAEGIMPDIVVEQRTFHSPEKAEKRITEENLIGHLENGEKKEDQQQAQHAGVDDYQLYEALNILKGAVLMKGKG